MGDFGSFDVDPFCRTGLSYDEIISLEQKLGRELAGRRFMDSWLRHSMCSETRERSEESNNALSGFVRMFVATEQFNAMMQESKPKFQTAQDSMFAFLKYWQLCGRTDNAGEADKALTRVISTAASFKSLLESPEANEDVRSNATDTERRLLGMIKPRIAEGSKLSEAFNKKFPVEAPLFVIGGGCFPYAIYDGDSIAPEATTPCGCIKDYLGWLTREFAALYGQEKGGRVLGEYRQSADSRVNGVPHFKKHGSGIFLSEYARQNGFSLCLHRPPVSPT
jgi:hypothetical protein